MSIRNQSNNFFKILLFIYMVLLVSGCTTPKYQVNSSLKPAVSQRQKMCFNSCENVSIACEQKAQTINNRCNAKAQKYSSEGECLFFLRLGVTCVPLQHNTFIFAPFQTLSLSLSHFPNVTNQHTRGGKSG